MLKLLLTYSVAVSHSTRGNHIPNKTVLTVFLAAGWSKSKTFICHTRKIKRLLFVCSSPLSWGTQQVTSYLLSHTHHWLHLVLSSVIWALLLYDSFLLPSIPHFFTVVMQHLHNYEGKSMIAFMQKLILLGSFLGLPFFFFRQKALLVHLM